MGNYNVLVTSVLMIYAQTYMMGFGTKSWIPPVSIAEQRECFLTELDIDLPFDAKKQDLRSMSQLEHTLSAWHRTDKEGYQEACSRIKTVFDVFVHKRDSKAVRSMATLMLTKTHGEPLYRPFHEITQNKFQTNKRADVIWLVHQLSPMWIEILLENSSPEQLKEVLPFIPENTRQYLIDTLDRETQTHKKAGGQDFALSEARLKQMQDFQTETEIIFAESAAEGLPMANDATQVEE